MSIAVVHEDGMRRCIYCAEWYHADRGWCPYCSGLEEKEEMNIGGVMSNYKWHRLTEDGDFFTDVMDIGACVIIRESLWDSETGTVKSFSITKVGRNDFRHNDIIYYIKNIKE